MVKSIYSRGSEEGIMKWLDSRDIYSIGDSSWVCPIQCVPKKGRMIVVPNEKNELVPIRPVT